MAAEVEDGGQNEVKAPESEGAQQQNGDSSEGEAADKKDSAAEDSADEAKGKDAKKGEKPKSGEAILAPNKVLRISAMLKQLSAEMPSSPMDMATRKELASIHMKSYKTISQCLSPDLRKELKFLAQRIKGGKNATVPSENDLRIAYAQLVGWLEGLFTGVQALLGAQQNGSTPAGATVKTTTSAKADKDEKKTSPEAELRPGQYL